LRSFRVKTQRLSTVRSFCSVCRADDNTGFEIMNMCTSTRSSSERYC